jgi:hypothetical protein
MFFLFIRILFNGYATRGLCSQTISLFRGKKNSKLFIFIPRKGLTTKMITKLGDSW